MLLGKLGRRVAGDLWKMEPRLDFNEGMLELSMSKVDGGVVDEGDLFDEFLRALDRRAEKKGMLLVGGGAEEVCEQRFRGSRIKGMVNGFAQQRGS